jgi:hypothetical protein
MWAIPSLHSNRPSRTIRVVTQGQLEAVHNRFDANPGLPEPV